MEIPLTVGVVGAVVRAHPGRGRGRRRAGLEPDHRRREDRRTDPRRAGPFAAPPPLCYKGSLGNLVAEERA
ncbi:MAG: hypothetical protein M0C28_39385 [Candidatus Moduliflexus flocculans]|nr:hypothetical protein [Candidatus Moduliflexus flocculans]